MTYTRLNNLVGWGVFALTLLVYLLTMAPTASFWDCGEFIACANELEVTHPPGAPLFLLLGRVFSMLSFGNVESIAWWINLISALASAFTALFTCWTTTMLARKGIDQLELSEGQRTWITLLAGTIAGFCCAFADSIWFNAVEAEVYALSSFFTAIVVWLMFKWEARADEPDHHKWIILIAYLMGLSIGVHLLNLLTIPALALVYYYRRYEFSWLGLLGTLGIAVGILAVIQYGIIQGLFEVAWGFEQTFTGTTDAEGKLSGMGMAPGTGSMIWASLIILSLFALLFISQRRQWLTVNVVTLSLTVILIGFSSYSMIFIRSDVNPPVDMNNPENVLTFLSYMRREQYGSRPLVYGPRYNAKITDFDRSAKHYRLSQDGTQYLEDGDDVTYIYRKGDEVMFPRMWSTQPYHYTMAGYGYKNYVDKLGANERDPGDDRPTRVDDIQFFVDYQLQHMYLRYFMWNFAGRSSDRQGAGWEDGLIRHSSRNEGNKSQNHYYFLPLIIGLLGLFWQASYRGNDAAIIGLLFLMTGIAIVLYLNQYPAQPRERDYSFAGSFQTFAIWIGLGALALVDLLTRYLKQATVGVVSFITLWAPTLMLSQNWDDHSRSGRWIDIDYAKNLLNSCAPNAILFTAGDNDTFPLWYVQEVEGYRTDVRLVNLELLISDWYVEGLLAEKNGAQPIPLSLDPKLLQGRQYEVMGKFPTDSIELPIDRAALANILSPTEMTWLPAGDVFQWKAAPGRSAGSYLLRRDAIILNMLQEIAQNGWQRPVYFSVTVPASSNVGLDPYLRMEGMAFRFVPVTPPYRDPQDPTVGWVDRAKSIAFFQDSFYNRSLEDPRVYMDDRIRTLTINGQYRGQIFRIMADYAEEALESRRSSLQLQAQAAKQIPGDTTDYDLMLIGYQQKIDQAHQKISELLTLQESLIPVAGTPKSFPILIQEYQALMRAGMDRQADIMWETESEQVWAELRNRREDGLELDPSNYALQFAFIAMRTYATLGDATKAQQIALALDQSTGEAVGTSMLQRFSTEP